MKIHYCLIFLLLFSNCVTDNTLKEKELALKEKELDLRERELNIKEGESNKEEETKKQNKLTKEAVTKKRTVSLSFKEFESSLDPYTTEYMLIYENKNSKKPILSFNVDTKQGKLIVNGTNYTFNEYRGQENSFQLLGNNIEILVTNEVDDVMGDCSYSIADATINIPRLETKKLKSIYIQRCSPLNFQ